MVNEVGKFFLSRNWILTEKFLSSVQIKSAYLTVHLTIMDFNFFIIISNYYSEIQPE